MIGHIHHRHTAPMPIIPFRSARDLDKADPDLLALLRAIVKAVEISSFTDFRFGGLEEDVLIGQTGPSGQQAHQPRPSLEDRLTAALYAFAYTRPWILRSDIGNAVSSVVQTQTPLADPAFQQSLAQASATRQGWDPGWTIFLMDDKGNAHARKEDRHRMAPAGTFRLEAAPGTQAAAGMDIALPVRPYDMVQQPGFTFVFGSTLQSEYDSVDMVRLYFHMDPAHVAGLIAEISSRLNSYGIPFSLKALSHPDAYNRADAVVLYLGKRYLPVALDHLEDALSERTDLKDALRTDVPLFCRALANGVGVADDPGNGQSFGMMRCHLLSKALLHSWRTGHLSDTDKTLERIAEGFARQGLSMAQPHINPGCRDISRPLFPSKPKKGRRHA